ncbi:MAG: universal stress protein [Anaerolineae bacterium]|nr:universal stress protein [Anaerolineae bacterium]
MQRFKNILLITDPSPDSEAALKQAVTLTRRNQARLTIAEMAEERPREAQSLFTAETLSGIHDRMSEIRRNHLRHLITPLWAEEINVSAKILEGPPFLAIIREVLAYNHDLVIITAEGDGGFKEMIFGSTTMHLMRKCPCPVWVVKPNQSTRFERIVAAVDPTPSDRRGNSLNLKILDLATSLARLNESELHIVHGWGLPGETMWPEINGLLTAGELEHSVRQTKKLHLSAVKDLLQNYDLTDLPHTLHVLNQDPGRLIPEVTQTISANLIVMGTVSRTGIAGFLIGNTAETVLHQVNCSVLTVKPERFVSPVKLEN